MEEDVTTEVPQPAILVRGVTKKYGNEANVLDNLNMTVMKGTIYGLLGASGCGKTTLLGAILGSRTIQNGSISILGEPPGVVPVKSIGYMPQDIALVGELSIRNVLQQQGWIFGMSNKEIEERHKLCEKLLDLPPGNRLIKNLSGGQQRRVSLAVVLIQDPELLILDEPTVGLDPVLRQNLWDYLIKITKEDKKTVVITTHYIEEAKQADTVAMLRHGKLIAEEEPQTLMNRLNYNSLEDLFVSLSAKQDQNDPNVNYIQQQNTLISKADELKILNQQMPKKSRLKELFFINRGHTKALLSKNFIRYIRNPASLIIMLCIPIIQISAAFLAIGNIPEDLTIGIVNQELGEYENCDLYTQNNSVGGYRVDEFGTCMFQGLSCKFTQGFRDIIKYQVFFDSMEDALKAVKNKKISQILFFPQNYSEAYTEVTNSNDVPPEELNFGKFAFYRDEIDNPLGLYVEKELYNFYLKFSEDLANDCEWSKRSARIPLLFNEPIYGKTELSFADFVAPGIMAITLLFLPMILAVTTIINEKRDGIWERTIVSGIKPVEIIICHTAALSVTSAIQTFECVILSCYVFGFESKGNLLYAALLLYQLAFLGISIGIFLSVLCRMEIEAIFGASAVGYPMLMLSGVVWPLEGQPSYLKFFSYFVASTIPVESLNNIFFRGWDIFHFDVYKGYLVTTGYICLCFVLCVLGLKFKKL